MYWMHVNVSIGAGKDELEEVELKTRILFFEIKTYV